jgi:hypothetical protein
VNNRVNVFCIYENRKMKPAEIVLRRGKREKDGRGKFK